MRPSLNKLLDRLNLVQTQGLVQALVAEHPEMIAFVDRYVSHLDLSSPVASSAKTVPINAPANAPAGKRRPSIDLAPIRRQVQDLLRATLRILEEGGEDYNSLITDLEKMVDQANGFSAQEDSHQALAILQVITETCVENWDELDEYGMESYELACILDKAWTEAILSTDLELTEKTELREQFQAWQDEWTTEFNVALAALHQGWDDPGLQQVLQGAPQSRASDPPYAKPLAQVRLKILQRQGRHQEYLHLAKAEHLALPYLTMLAQEADAKTVVAAAEKFILDAGEAYAIAKVLRELGQLPEALELAQKGLQCSGIPEVYYQLATWTRELAKSLGERTAALQATIQGFNIRPSLQDYQQAQTFAAEDWPQIKITLLKILHKNTAWFVEQAKVDIFLHEHLIEDAISTVKGLSSHYAELIQRVMAQTTATHPDWIIGAAPQRAEEILDRGKAQDYHIAVAWLDLTHQAYDRSNRHQDWLTYRGNLVRRHGRKRKFMALMQAKNLLES
jgi:uncharacterized Zn finger protein